MRHFQQIANGIDVSGVMAELADDPSLWNEHQIRRTAPGTPHRTSSDIWVRYRDVAPYENGERPWSEFNDIHVPVWYPAWKALPSLRPIIFALMAKVEGEMLGGILITRIAPGGRIEPHSDFSWHVDAFEKFYVTIQGQTGARFHCEHEGHYEFIEPKNGECWLFNNKKKHWVTNDSEQCRITLIICIRREQTDNSI